jgi:8-oxo-dGTP diphosphatase
MLLVVRHADAGDKSTWKGPDHLRPLSPSGHLQAEGLVLRLEDYPVERILCSPTLRCHQTVQPLARDRLLRIESVPALGVDASPAQLLALFWDPELRHSVLCTHGEGIGLLLTRLIADTLWWRIRWTGTRDPPGCWSAPTGDRCAAASWPRWCSARPEPHEP